MCVVSLSFRKAQVRMFGSDRCNRAPRGTPAEYPNIIPCMATLCSSANANHYQQILKNLLWFAQEAPTPPHNKTIYIYYTDTLYMYTCLKPAIGQNREASNKSAATILAASVPVFDPYPSSFASSPRKNTRRRLMNLTKISRFHNLGGYPIWKGIRILQCGPPQL